MDQFSSSEKQHMNKINWPWFVVGCIILLAALAAFFWAFSLETLNPSRRFLLMWILPLASGFACGCFAGSLKVTGPLGDLVIAATGGFAVWLLSFYLLPKIPDNPLPQPPEPIRLTADSGWVEGGDSLQPFCDRQKVVYQQQYPGKSVECVNMHEDHKSEYTPFKA